MSTAIFWLRNDLRSSDNEALLRAIDQHDQILPVFIWDEAWFAPTEFGFPRMGNFRARFLQESLEDLQAELQSRGSDLIIRRGDPVIWVKKFADSIQTSEIYCAAAYSSFEIQQEQALKQSGLTLHSFHTSTLVPPAELPMELSQLPDVFTAFRKKVEKYSRIPDPFPKPESIAMASSEFSSEENFTFNETPMKDPRAVLKFKGGSDAAWKRLDHYFWKSESLASYKETRNGLIGADYSSKFSPWLALGCISAREIYHEVKRFEKEIKKNSSTYWLVFELLWRDYFQFVAMKYGNRLFWPSGIKGEPRSWSVDKESFEKWCSGETGQDFVDANMREFNATGFMSNRGRQNVASYLTKDLKIDWRAGAAYFEYLLIDHDPYSNYGNWQYVAGVGNDPREDRYFNVSGQAERYDPTAQYRALWREKSHVDSM